jgi:DHA2 family multidrug resistance protein
MMCGMSVVTFSSVVLLPQFTQNVLGFSAQDAGMVMTPGALMLLVLMPVSARIANKVDPRLAISLGFLAFAAGLTATSLFASLSVTQSDLMLLRMAQNVGILLLALPINVLMYVGLAPGDGGSASAMINLMRNLGSSIGASLAVEWLVRGTQIHQSQLLGRVNVLDRAYQVYTRAIAGSFDAGTMPALLESVIRKQALLLSYIDDFRYFATIALLLAPMIWLSRRAIGVSPPPAH